MDPGGPPGIQPDRRGCKRICNPCAEINTVHSSRYSLLPRFCPVLWLPEPVEISPQNVETLADQRRSEPFPPDQVPDGRPRRRNAERSKVLGGGFNVQKCRFFNHYFNLHRLISGSVRVKIRGLYTPYPEIVGGDRGDSGGCSSWSVTCARLESAHG